MLTLLENLQNDPCSMLVFAGTLLLVGSKMVAGKERARILGLRLGGFGFLTCVIHGWMNSSPNHGSDLLHVALAGLIAGALVTAIGWIILSVLLPGGRT